MPDWKNVDTSNILDFIRTSRDAAVFTVVMNQLVAQDLESLSMVLRVEIKALFSELPFPVFRTEIGNINRHSSNRQEDKSQGLLRSRKKEIIGTLLDRGQLDMVLIILKTLETGPRELRELSARPGMPSILWQACDSEHVELVKYILDICGGSVRDDPAPGTLFSAVDVRFHGILT